MARTVALLKHKAQAMLNIDPLSIAKMNPSTDDEAAALTDRFNALTGKMTKAAFARRFGLPGGASMLSQHLSGNRPMSLEAAMAYARGFDVPLDEISKRLADQVRAAACLLVDADSQHIQPSAIAELERALPVVLRAVGGMTIGRWEMVRTRLDRLPGHPEGWEDIAADILPMLAPAPSKRLALG